MVCEHIVHKYAPKNKKRWNGLDIDAGWQEDALYICLHQHRNQNSSRTCNVVVAVRFFLTALHLILDYTHTLRSG